MNTFRNELKSKLASSFKNNYGIENFDEHRFGTFVPVEYKRKKGLKNVIKKLIQYQSKSAAENKLIDIAEYEDRLQKTWSLLNKEDKKLLAAIIAYRLLGYQKVKLPVNNRAYWEALKKVKTLKNTADTIDPHFLHFILEKFNITPIGFDINFYYTDLGIATDFIIEQYAYKAGGKTLVVVEEGDTVLDLGGCWGDTALYFAHKAGEKGKVYSFEFIPANIKIFNINIELNTNLKNRIQLITNPISNVSDVSIYFKDNGPGSQIKLHPFDSQSETALTLSIDDFMQRHSVQKIDFIKMDIEGAEMAALEGAINTIKKFKPKLAIAIYHSMDDLVNIPLWIKELNLGYEIFIGHYTIHAEETICFAKPKFH
jgi:FkbM family methyltransferase